MTKLNPRAVEGRDKFLDFIASLQKKDWHEYCHNGRLNLSMIADECGISRSTINNNVLVKAEVLSIATKLYEEGIIESLPYQAKDKKINSVSPFHERTNKEMAKLHEENRKLQNKVSELQASLADMKAKLNQFEAMERILGESGRLPR